MIKTLLLTALALGGTCTTQAQTPRTPLAKLHPTPLPKKAPRAADGKWLPTHETVYTPDGNGGWQKYAEYRYTYDEQGNRTEELADNGTDKAKVVSTYDAYGQLLTETSYRNDSGSDELKPRMLKQYTYDADIHDLATSFHFSTMKDGKWAYFYGSCYKRTVERDEQGRVVSVTKSVLDGEDSYHDELKSVYGYNGDSKAPNTYEYLTESGGALATSAKYADLKWARNTGEYIGAFSMSWFMNGNFLESATIKSDSYGDLYLNATDKGGGSFEIEQKYAAEAYKSMKEVQTYEPTDEYGGFCFSELIYYNLDGGTPTDADLYQGNITLTAYDDHGNMTLYEARNVNQTGIDNAQTADGMKYEYVYGGEHGEATETTTWAYSYTEQQYLLESKVVADEFCNTATGITHTAAMTAGNDDAAVYNMQGVKVADDASTPLPHGIYITGGRKIVK